MLVPQSIDGPLGIEASQFSLQNCFPQNLQPETQHTGSVQRGSGGGSPVTIQG